MSHVPSDLDAARAAIRYPARLRSRSRRSRSKLMNACDCLRQHGTWVDQREAQLVSEQIEREAAPAVTLTELAGAMIWAVMFVGIAFLSVHHVALLIRVGGNLVGLLP